VLYWQSVRRIMMVSTASQTRTSVLWLQLAAFGALALALALAVPPAVMASRSLPPL
jgi:hypothetical protein